MPSFNSVNMPLCLTTRCEVGAGPLTVLATQSINDLEMSWVKCHRDEGLQIHAVNGLI